MEAFKIKMSTSVEMQPKIKTGKWMDRGMARWIRDTANSEVFIVKLSVETLLLTIKLFQLFFLLENSK